MAKIKLKIIGSPQIAASTKGDTINAKNVLEILQHQRRLTNYEYDYSIFLNGARVDDESQILRDGDEVILIPILSGG